MTRRGKILAEKVGTEPQVCCSGSRWLNHWPTRQSASWEVWKRWLGGKGVGRGEGRRVMGTASHFLWLSHTSHWKCYSSVATLLGARHCRVIAKNGLPGVSIRPVYPYDFAIIFTGKMWNYGNYGQKIILREKNIKKNPTKFRLLPFWSKVKQLKSVSRHALRLTLLQRWWRNGLVCWLRFWKLHFFPEITGFFSEILQVQEIGVNGSAV